VEGVVSEFLFGPDEVARGLLLDDGTRVRWPEEVTFTFTKIVSVGDKVKASGWLKKSTTGEINLEVSTLTNLTNRKTATNDKAALPPAKDKKSTDR
jgi:lysyl-tRNA synthetase class II